MKLTEAKLRKLIQEELQLGQKIILTNQIAKLHHTLNYISVAFKDDPRAAQLARHTIDGLEALHGHLKKQKQKVSDKQ
jgi:hypothetical protein